MTVDVLRSGRLVAVALALAAGCAAPVDPGPAVAAPDAPAAPDAVQPPYVLVLGTAQDGGLPHAGCVCPHCTAARTEPARARAVASLAIVPPPPAEPWLIDVTPDVREQLDRLPGLGADTPGRVDRDPLDGVLLTHAHLGHYTGLGFFGFEAMNVDGLTVRATPSMSAYLAGNAPWSQLVERGNLRLAPLEPGRPLELPGGVRVTAMRVPHRDELSDTVAYRVEGPARTVFYVPDTDGWDGWDPPLDRCLEGVDVALLDGTFYSPDELPGRAASSIGHPLVRDTMDRLQPLVDAGSIDVRFTHLNHSNPALDPGGPERAEIERRGYAVLADGARIPL